MNNKIIQILAHCNEAVRLARELESELRPLASLFGGGAVQPKRMRKYRKLPDSIKKQVLDLRAKGVTLSQCAERTGLSETSVNRIVAQARKKK